MGLSEKSLAKARRLLDEGSVIEVTATRNVRRPGRERDVSRDAGGEGAACDCRARLVPCSHIAAVLMATGDRPARTVPANPERPSARGPGGRLFTWSWREALDANPPGVTLVRISVGRPKWVPARRTAAIPYIRELAPVGELFHLDGDEFDRRYRERLVSIGADGIEQRFREVSETHDGLPLVLLCFERYPADCHRSTFARWWTELTGEIIPEFETWNPW